MADAETQPLAKVLYRPGIPVVKKPGLSYEWVLMWFAACFAVFVLPLSLVKHGLYSQKNIYLMGDKELNDLVINVQGCDVAFEPSNSHFEIRLGFWSFMGAGSVKHENGRVEVNATMTKKALGFHCLLVANVPSWYKGPHFKNLDLAIEPSGHALTLPRPSNVAEMIGLNLDSVRVQSELRVNVSTMCDTTLHNTQASSTQVFVQGGSLTIIDGPLTEGTIAVQADNAMVVVRSEESDLAIALDEVSAPAAALAGLSIQAENSTGWAECHRLVAGKSTGEEVLEVQVHATDSAIYAIAANVKSLREHGECPELAVHRGALAAGPPRVASDGVGDLHELKQWLQSPTNAVEFSVYIHVPPPQEGFNGMLKLVSTEIYTALSPIGFALLSGGAMEPYVVRLSIPMLGMPWAFPPSTVCATPSAKEIYRYGTDVLRAVDDVVDIYGLGLKSAKWVWQAEDQPVFIFDHVPSRNGRSDRWKSRPLSALSSFTFRAAATITLLAGVLTGFAICKILWMTLRPFLMDKVRTADIFSTASYRLAHTNEAVNWVVAATFVSWPLPGILLRWSKRPKRTQFVTFSFSVRSWPPVTGDADFTIDGIDSWRLPDPPSFPDQECFLFCTEPESKKRKVPWFPDTFDEELFSLGMMQAGKRQRFLDIGMPYQFQVVAKDATGAVVDTSSWSRPTVVQPPRAFTEYPLLLWRASCGIIPENTLQTFLMEHCHPIEPSPTLVLSLSNIRFAADSASTLFIGEPNGVYGAVAGTILHTDPPQQVVVSFSNAGDNVLYESTKPVLLPSQEEKAMAASLVKSYAQALPDRPKGFAPGLENSKFVVLNFPTDTLSVPVPYDLTTFVTVEAAIQTPTGQKPDTAKVVMSWHQMLEAVRRSRVESIVTNKKGSSRGSVVPAVSVDMVLRDGLTPVGVLSFQCSFSNSVLGELTPPKQQTGPSAPPDCFQSLLPGSTFVWGETITLSWTSNSSEKRISQGQTFDLVLVSEGYNQPGKLSHNHAKNVKVETVVGSSVSANAGKQAVTLSPEQAQTCQLMRCRLEARSRGPEPRSSLTSLASNLGKGLESLPSFVTQTAKGTVLMTSWDFLITRPVTLQQLELHYAAFCIRNRIPMQRVPLSKTKSLLVEDAERRLYYCAGYRAPLPMPSEIAEEPLESGQGPLVVENSSSVMITGAEGLRVGGRFGIATPAPEPLPPEMRGDMAAAQSPRTSTTPRASASGGDLSAPLLAAEASKDSPSKAAGEAAAAVDPISSRQVLAKQDNVLITTNVFWRWDSQCRPHLFLKYWFMPRFAEPNWWRSHFQYLGWDKTAELENADIFMRYFIGIILYCGQMGVMGFPGLVLFSMWLWHDSVMSRMLPDLIPKGDAHHVVLVDFVISPNWSRWYHIEPSAKVVYVTMMTYISVVFVTTYYNNFVHAYQQKASRLFPFINKFVAGMWAFSFFLTIVLLTVVVVWIIMGALVNPGILMPYAIMLIAMATLAYTLHGKLSEMVEHASKGIRHLLEHLLRAIFEVFIENPEADGELEEFRQFLQTLAVSITENMEQIERPIKAALLKGSSIIPEVGGALRTQMETLRNSAYFTTLEGQSKNKPLITDFTPGNAAMKADIVAKAQQISIEMATIEGTNMLGTTQTKTETSEDGTTVATSMAAVAPPISPASLAKAVANAKGLPMEKPGELSTMAQASVPKLSSQLLVNPATALAAVNGYVLQLQLARAKRRPPKLENALSCANLFSRIRHDRLLSHFMPHEAKGSDGTVKEDCNARKILLDLQKAELENLPVKAAAVFTNFIDWTVIGRKGASYVTTTLYTQVVPRAINEETSAVIDGSAAFNLVMQANELAYAKTAGVYASDPLQVFVDLGIIQLRHKHLPETQRILTGVVNSQRAFDNSLGPLNVISAVKVLCLPDHKPAPVNDIPARSFLWYGALVRILKKLGWTQDEMASDWLARKWRGVTQGTGIFPYEGIAEVVDLVFNLSSSGLWKAGAKGLMLDVKVGGYLGFDVARDGVKAAAQGAHNLSLNVDLMNLEAVMNNSGTWPDWVESIWKNVATSSGSIDPLFLLPEKIIDFLQEIVYTSAQPQGQTFSQLSPYASNVFDLVWCHAGDNRVWHTIGATRRQLRGLWLELALEVFTQLDCVPTDLDIFLQALRWQYSELKTASTSQLHLYSFADWLRTVYFKDLMWCTFSQFKGIMMTALKVDIPEDVLKEQIFTPCPKDPNDDLGELRRLTDLGVALQTWLGFGLWPTAISAAVDELLPPGRVLTVAKGILQEEFNKLDADGLGVLQPGAAMLLMHRLMVPGLTCDDMKAFIDSQLSCNVPEREVHKYFVMMDVNGDGVLSAEEFIPLFVYFTFDFFPAQILRKLGLGPGNIAAFLVSVLSVLAMIFALVSLVISAFPTGRTISSSIHTIVSGATAWGAKQSSDKSIGFEDTMTNLKAQLEKGAMEAVVGVLGVSQAVVVKFTALTKSVVA